MNNNLQMVYTYHNETKHAPARYARSLGYMDWATQPDPYRSYEGTRQIKLPLSFDNNTAAYKDIFDTSRTEKAPFCLESISQFFQFSLGLAAVKTYEGQSWALRCNASSGNLQPSESYILTNDIEGIDAGLYHYGVKDHHLELLSTTKDTLDMPKESFIVGLSSIVWREAWKYGERSWRYTQLDCGHAYKALEISAKILGWDVELLDSKDEEITSLLGLDDIKRYIPEESERADMLLLVSKNSEQQTVDIQKLRKSLQDKYFGKANSLSSARHNWEILEKIEDAVSTTQNKNKILKSKKNILRECEYSAKDIVLKRRSAQVMNKNDAEISKKEFETILSSVKSEETHPVNLVLFVHSVDKLPSGLYILLGDNNSKNDLSSSMKDLFLWEKVKSEVDDLYFLQGGDFKLIAKTISCNQDIAAHGAFSLGMLVEFDKQLQLYGAHRYKELYWNCGAIGQQLYLEATSLKLSATGIGCFLDDILHDVLGLQNSLYQSLYHFTIGRGLVDSRLSNIEPYSNRD
jgi:SagB-type dehydrogenase family enzyme